MAKMVLRVKNNPTKRGFYAAAYRSEPATETEVALGITCHLMLVEKIECGTRKLADKAWGELKAKYNISTPQAA